MKRRIVLHIGLSKTGTTSIQKFLSENRDRLAAQGILYPDVSGMRRLDPRLAPSVLRPSAEREPHHIALAIELRRPRGDRPERNTQTPLWSAVFRQIEEMGADTTIISYENFYLRPEHYSFDLLSTYLKDFDVQGIIYLRPLEDWMVSLYSQAVKGVDRRDSEFANYTSSYAASSRYSYLIDSILEHLPIGALSIVDFYLAAKGDLIRDFLDRSGVAGDLTVDHKPELISNVSLPSWATLFLLRCNCVRVSDEAFLEIRKVLSRSIQRPWAPQLRQGLDVAAPEDRRRLDDIAVADADRLWQRHGVKLTQKTRESIAYRPFDDEDIRSIIGAIGPKLSPAARSELDQVQKSGDIPSRERRK